MLLTRCNRGIHTRLFFVLILSCSGVPGFSQEGMWLPSLLGERETDMQKKGLEIPVEKLFNKDGTGLNNAIVLFGGGCTGEIISSKGLLLTNHHCGYGTVQRLSSREKDYFANGFWAMNTEEEIPCPGLTVTFIRNMENVSGQILSDIPDTLADQHRNKLIEGRIKALEKGYRYTTGMDAAIKPFYNGNQYWVIMSETYRDIRLTGFPPNGIGQFGGDTDNWMWPRHTGDFSVFRVYAGKDNKPAAYNADNKPYHTDNFLSINISGYKEGDFTMVYGFPGSTQQYISSYQLNHIYNIIDPIRIAARTVKLEVWREKMAASRDVFLKYTSKQAGVANGWKKWQGEIRGLRINEVPALKAAFETEFQQRATTAITLPYAKDILAHISARTSKADSALAADIAWQEALMGIELLRQAGTLHRMLLTMRAGLPPGTMKDSLRKIATSLDGFYKNYDAVTDRAVFASLIPEYLRIAGTRVPAIYLSTYAGYRYDADSWADAVYDMSLLTHPKQLQDFAAGATLKDTMRLRSDPAWQLYDAAIRYRETAIKPVLADYHEGLAYYNRLFTKAQMTLFPQRKGYPDANMTLRLAYGKVEGINAEGSSGYSFQTNLDQVIAKDNPAVAEFSIPEKLKSLHAAKDYGRWEQQGTVPVCFIAGNHTSGGNSGSPLLNSKGQLIGTNFDRIWEGTMSDLYFDPKLCRNISVDIRYTLFIIEKFGGAGWLLKEMRLVR